MKPKKGAIELSMTTIIVIVLGITLLTLGLMFVRGIFSKINVITKTTFEDADKQIRSYMSSSNSKLYVLGADTTMKPKTSQIMYAGIRNSKGVDDKFMLKVISADGKSDITWIEIPTIATTIKAGEYKTITMNVKVPGIGAVAGDTYMYQVEAYSGDNTLYDSDYLTILIE